MNWISTTHKKNIKDLEKRSEKLISINTAFQKFLKARDRSKSKKFVKIACFFEEYSMYKAEAKIEIIVFKKSAFLADIDPQSIQANHVDMCKFENEDREKYKKISQKLSQWISDLESKSKKSEENSQVEPSFTHPKLSEIS